MGKKITKGMNLGRFVIFRQINREIKQNQTKHDKSPKKKEKLNIPPPPPNIQHTCKKNIRRCISWERVGGSNGTGADTCRSVKKKFTNELMFLLVHTHCVQ